MSIISHTLSIASHPQRIIDHPHISRCNAHEKVWFQDRNNLSNCCYNSGHVHYFVVAEK